mmetsp:Transcript_22163/g.87925  ORF Transcript_22163/g.87925 Transcript_22163/m.87925 type:complete len:274 (-) Transcript_22163:58-879(-)
MPDAGGRCWFFEEESSSAGSRRARAVPAVPRRVLSAMPVSVARRVDVRAEPRAAARVGRRRVHRPRVHRGDVETVSVVRVPDVQVPRPRVPPRQPGHDARRLRAMRHALVLRVRRDGRGKRARTAPPVALPLSLGHVVDLLLEHRPRGAPRHRAVPPRHALRLSDLPDVRPDPRPVPAMRRNLRRLPRHRAPDRAPRPRPRPVPPLPALVPSVRLRPRHGDERPARKLSVGRARGRECTLYPRGPSLVNRLPSMGALRSRGRVMDPRAGRARR